MKRFLFTGGAGFIGSHVVDCLLQQGHEAIAVDDLTTGRPENLRSAALKENFRFSFGDICEPGILEALCEKFQPDAIIHLAGLVSVIRADQEPDLNFRLNLESTQRVVEAARKTGVSRIVFSSSAAVYGDTEDLPIVEGAEKSPINLYGSAKLLSEQLLAAHAATFDLSCVSLRFFNVYGPRQDPRSPYSGVMSIFADRFKRDLPVTVFGNGTQTRDFVSVFDVARAVAKAASAEEISSGEYNVATGRAVRILDILEAFQTMYPSAPSPQFETARSGEIMHSLADPSKAADELGFQARVSLQYGIRSLVSGGLPETPSGPRTLLSKAG